MKSKLLTVLAMISIITAVFVISLLANALFIGPSNMCISFSFAYGQPKDCNHPQIQTIDKIYWSVVILVEVIIFFVGLKRLNKK